MFKSLLISRVLDKVILVFDGQFKEIVSPLEAFLIALTRASSLQLELVPFPTVITPAYALIFGR
jgi:hypothetical protein